MKLASIVVKLPIVSVNEGEKIAVVNNLFVSRKSKKVEYLGVAKSEEEVIPSVVSFNEVEGIGDDYIIVPSLNSIKKISSTDRFIIVLEDCFSLLDRKVLSLSGNILGRILDYSINEQTGAIENIILDSGQEIYGSAIVTLSPKFIMVNADAKPGENIEIVEMSPLPSSSLDVDSISYLVGKTVTEDVVSRDGAFIIKTGTVLTQELVIEAEANDVLVGLAMAV